MIETLALLRWLSHEYSCIPDADLFAYVYLSGNSPRAQASTRLPEIRRAYEGCSTPLLLLRLLRSFNESRRLYVGVCGKTELSFGAARY